MTRDAHDPARPARGAVRLTLIGLWAEALGHAFWPLWSLVMAGLAALAFDLPAALPIEALWIGGLALALALFWALARGLRRLRAPRWAQALARVDARLPGQPLAALGDRPALGQGDPVALALWQAHRSRMAGLAQAARPVPPRLRLAAQDPFALRHVAALAFAMAALFGSFWQAAGTLAGLGAPAPALAAAGPSWEGWAEPPAHTGLPRLYLPDQAEGALGLPQGSKITVKFYGEPGAHILAETVSGRTDVPPASASQDFTLARSGRLEIEGAGGRAWAVTAQPDRPPRVIAQGPLTREAEGRFGLAFQAEDDYGLRAGSVALVPDLPAIDRRHGLAIDPEPEALAPVVLDLPMPMTRDRRRVADRLSDDLSASLLANLPVSLRLSLRDGAGQTGTAPALHAILPARRFLDPLAASLVEMRRDLLWNRANAPRVAQILKALTWRPADHGAEESLYLRLRQVIRQLDGAGPALTAPARDAVAAELWALALQVEEGDLASALARLHRAQDRLAQAMRQGASPDEIDRLMGDLERAMQDYLRQLAQQAEPGQDTAQADPGLAIDQDRLQAMLDRLQQLMAEGRLAEAEALLEQLRQLMDNLRVTQGGAGQGQGGAGQEALNRLGQALKDQQGLADDAFRDLQAERQGGAGPGPEGQALADRQQELRDRLGELGRQGGLPGPTSPGGQAGRDGLGRAGRAMDQAEEALRQGDLGGALDRQAEAMQNLRQAIRDYGQALAQDQTGNSQASGAEMGRDDPNSARDPLGRQLGGVGRIGSQAGMLQGPDVYRRAQELLDEIRRRAADQARPADERGYLRRLLELF